MIIRCRFCGWCRPRWGNTDRAFEALRDHVDLTHQAEYDAIQRRLDEECPE